MLKKNILVYGAPKFQEDILKKKGVQPIKSAKQFWFLASKLPYISMFITYINPDDSSLLRNMVSKALDQGAEVRFYSHVGASPTKIVDVKYNKIEKGPYTRYLLNYRRK